MKNTELSTCSSRELLKSWFLSLSRSSSLQPTLPVRLQSVLCYNQSPLLWLPCLFASPRYDLRGWLGVKTQTSLCLSCSFAERCFQHVFWLHWQECLYVLWIVYAICFSLFLWVSSDNAIEEESCAPRVPTLAVIGVCPRIGMYCMPDAWHYVTYMAALVACESQSVQMLHT